jgi:hypothetical protein
MSFGRWRGVTLAIVIWAGAGAGSTAWARQFHVIPREVPAIDVRTGQLAYAPPIPYGEYAKDYCGTVKGALGHLCALCGGLGCKHCGFGHKGGSVCGNCGGAGCGSCLGKHGGFLHGKGLFHHGGAGDPCGNCGGVGCGLCATPKRSGLFHHAGLRHGSRVGGSSLCGPGKSCASGQAGPAAVFPNSQSLACGSCRGKGCGLCGGRGFFGGLHGRNGGSACGQCGGSGLFAGKGCGLCGGRGFLHHGDGDPCGNCGGAGCGLCQKGHGGKLCKHCGGGGCGHCIGMIHGLAAKVFHVGYVNYFVGPGGPVPLTPGYVPYVVPVRSPRDFLAFPPYTSAFP